MLRVSRILQTLSVDVEGLLRTKCGKLEYGRVYLDNQATTCIDPRVLDSMMPYLTYAYGNPHSRTHSFGWEAEKAVEDARLNVANLLNCQPKNIIFTSGATESNNLAIKGAKSFYARLTGSQGKPRKNHIITTQIEHKCVLQCCRQLETEGYDVTYLKPNQYGIISPEQVAENIKPETFLCTIMHINNEIGVIQDIKEIGKVCKEKNILFHTDAAQGFGKVPIDLNDLNIDLLSISGHKIYGPKGIGALYVRTKPRVRLQPIIDGGGQERGLRSGTLPTALVVGLGTASKIAQNEMHRDLIHLEKLFHKIIDGLKPIKHTSINGSILPHERYPGNLNISFKFIEGESLLMSLSNIAVSSGNWKKPPRRVEDKVLTSDGTAGRKIFYWTSVDRCVHYISKYGSKIYYWRHGSACTSSSLEPSYVLRSLDVSEEVAHTSIRFGMGRFTTESEVDYLIKNIYNSVIKLRELSPLYEMYINKEDDKMLWT